MMLYYLLFF